MLQLLLSTNLVKLPKDNFIISLNSTWIWCPLLFMYSARCADFLQVFLTPRYLAIAMEYVPGGDMFDHVVRKGGLKESEARQGLLQRRRGIGIKHTTDVVTPLSTTDWGCLNPFAHDSHNSYQLKAEPLTYSYFCRWFFQQLIVGVDYLHRMVSTPCSCCTFSV